MDVTPCPSGQHDKADLVGGSIVRDDFSDKSDVDIIVSFSKPIGVEFIDLANFIESKLNKKVDLVSKNGVKPKYFHQFESEIIYV